MDKSTCSWLDTKIGITTVSHVKGKGKRGLHLTDILVKFYILEEKYVPNKIYLQQMLIDEHLETKFSCIGKEDILRKAPSRQWGQNPVKRNVRK